MRVFCRSGGSFRKSVSAPKEASAAHKGRRLVLRWFLGALGLGKARVMPTKVTGKSLQNPMPVKLEHTGEDRDTQKPQVVKWEPQG